MAARWTPLGRCWAAGAVLAGVAGWLLGWPELTVPALTVALATLLGLLWSLGRPRASVTLGLSSRRVEVGRPAVAEVSVTADRRPLPGSRLELPVGDDVAVVRLGPLLPGARLQEQVPVPTSRRGLVRVGPVSSVRGDPIGLFRHEVVRTPALELVVHPRTVALEHVGAGTLRDLEGRTTSDLSNHDLAFHALREYVPGDDRRHVHWRTSAKRSDGALLVRQFVDTRRSSLAVALVTDAGAYADPDEFETAVAVAGSLVRFAVAGHLEVVLVAGTQALPTPAGPAALDALAPVALTRPSGNPARATAATAAHAAGAAPRAGVALLVAGSAVGMAAQVEACESLPADARRVLARVDPSASPASLGVGGSAVLRVRTVDDLPHALWAATA